MPATRSSTGLAEIAVIVDDVPDTTRFYRDVVGLPPDGTADTANEGWARFQAGEPGGSQRLAPLLFEEHSPLPRGERWERFYYAFLGPRERLSAVEHVLANGIEVYGPIALGWMRASSYCFHDSARNLFEFSSPVQDGSPNEEGEL